MRSQRVGQDLVTEQQQYQMIAMDFMLPKSKILFAKMYVFNMFYMFMITIFMIHIMNRIIKLEYIFKIS